MRAFLVQAVSTFVNRPAWVFLLGLSVLLALIGPFGSYEGLSLPMRLVYWMPIVLGAHVMVKAAHVIVDRALPQATPLQWQLAAVIVFSAIFSPAVWAYSKLFSDRFDRLESLLLMAGNVFGVALTLGLVVYFVTRHGRTEEDTASPPRLYERLPDGKVATIVRLTVNDHYVEVFLDDGSSHRLLMRLADAVSEMDDTPGFYTHRSHWVASAYVRDAVRENRRDFLVLKTGAKVPVTKTFRESVRLAGFL